MCHKVTKKTQTNNSMEFKKLKTQSLFDALKSMAVGETCIAPDECRTNYVKRACSSLKESGYVFITSTKSGERTITRLK